MEYCNVYIELLRHVEYIVSRTHRTSEIYHTGNIKVRSNKHYNEWYNSYRHKQVWTDVVTYT